MSSVLGTAILGYTMYTWLGKKILSHRAELPTFNTMTDFLFLQRKIFNALHAEKVHTDLGQEDRRKMPLA